MAEREVMITHRSNQPTCRFDAIESIQERTGDERIGLVATFGFDQVQKTRAVIG